MKSSLAIILIYILFSIPGWTQPDEGNERIIKVLSFNILHGATTRGDFDLDAIAKVIIDTDPDLVALQEVDFKTTRVNGLDLATELGWRTKMAPLFGRAMDFRGGEYGEGILSRYSFVKSRNILLPHSPGSEPRAALEIITVLPSGDTITFIGTHLDHLKDEKDRIAQVEKINEVFRDNRYPTLLAGDLNATPRSVPIKILEKHWTPSYEKKNPQPTFPSDNPRVKIDYVMFLPKERWKVLETKVIRDSIASDHCAYFVTLELLEKR